MTQVNAKSGTSTTRPSSSSQRTAATCFWGTQVAVCLSLGCMAIVQGSTVLIDRVLSSQRSSVIPLLPIFWASFFGGLYTPRNRVLVSQARTTPSHHRQKRKQKECWTLSSGTIQAWRSTWLNFCKIVGGL